MKKSTGLTILIGIVALAAGPAMADSLSVNAVAAMNGTNYGLEVLHDNSSVAYVQDDTPAGETIYRFSFLYNPTDIGSSGNGNPFRFTIFTAMADNARPDTPGNPCPLNVNLPVFPARIFAAFGGPGLTIPGVRLTMMNNFCGVLGTTPVYWTENVPKRICGFVETGTPGRAGLAVVDVASACPPDGDPAYSVAVGNNNEIPITGARLGNVAINPYGAGENGSIYLDEFESYRTLAP